MRRYTILAFGIVCLAIWSGVAMGQGNRPHFLPLVAKAGPPLSATPTLVSASATAVPTATTMPGVTMTPVSPLLVPNGDFEAGNDGTWYTDDDPDTLPAIQQFPQQLPEPPYQGSWAVRFALGTEDELWQEVVVPADRPFLTFRARVVSTQPDCAIVPSAGVGDYRVRVCAETAAYGWFEHSVDYRDRIGETVLLSVDGPFVQEGEFWVDQIEWRSQPLDSTAPPMDTPHTEGVAVENLTDYHDAYQWYFQGLLANQTDQTIYQIALKFRFYQGDTLVDERWSTEEYVTLVPQGDTCVAASFSLMSGDFPTTWDRYEIAAVRYFTTNRVFYPLEVSIVSASVEGEYVSLRWRATNVQQPYVQYPGGTAWRLDAAGRVLECDSVGAPDNYLYQGDATLMRGHFTRVPLSENVDDYHIQAYGLGVSVVPTMTPTGTNARTP